MKILHVTPFFYPAYEYGGVPRLAYELSCRLAQKGHEVTVYTTDCYSRDKRCERSGCVVQVEGIETHYFRNVSNYLAYNYLFPLPQGLAITIKKNIASFDIIHMWSHRHLLNSIVRNEAVKQGIPYVFSAHGSVLKIERFFFLKKIFDLLWGDRVLRNANACIAVSEAEKCQYLQAGIDPKKIHLIPNGLESAAGAQLPERGVFKKRYGLSDKHIIAFLGRISLRKGVDVLIKAFSKIYNKDLVLVIAGSDMGFQRKAMKLAYTCGVEGRVLFPGYLDDVAKKEFFVDSVMVVYPSVDEIFGLVPFEALLCGTPVIVSNDCGCGEIIAKAQAGYTYDYGDVAGLATLIQKALRNKEDTEDRVRKGQLFIRAQLDWQVIVPQTIELYRHAIKGVH